MAAPLTSEKAAAIALPFLDLLPQARITQARIGKPDQGDRSGLESKVPQAKPLRYTSITFHCKVCYKTQR
ncbi:hypothetical protein [Thermoleptolyngbya sp.]